MFHWYISLVASQQDAHPLENENKKADPSPKGEHTVSLLGGGGWLFLIITAECNSLKINASR